MGPERPPGFFIPLNSGDASETLNVHTVGHCMAYVRRWGCGGLVVANLFAFRVNDSSILRRVAVPVGPENDQYLAHLVAGTDQVICCWGN